MNPASTAAHELETWWLEKAQDEILRTVPKAIEYGAGDLVAIGRQLAAVSGREVDDQHAAEMGVYFYLIGKVARWTAAIEQDRLVSDDTLLDIGVYVRMAQRIRDAGEWPGVEQKESEVCGFRVVTSDLRAWYCQRPAGHEHGPEVVDWYDTDHIIVPQLHAAQWPLQPGTRLFMEGIK